VIITLSEMHLFSLRNIWCNNLCLGDMKQKKILSFVFNTIENDGRVIRATEALSDNNSTLVVSIKSDEKYRNNHFQNISVKINRKTRYGKILSFVSFYGSVIKVSKKYKPDLVYAHDYYMALGGFLISKLNISLFAYDAHELFIPERGVELGFRQWIWYLLESVGIRYSDLLIAANSARASVMKDHYNLNRLPLTILNIPERPISRVSIECNDSNPWGGGSEMVNIVYQGDVNYDRNIERFIKAISYMEPQYCLVIIGDGPSSKSIYKKYQKLIYTGRLKLVGRVKMSDIHKLLSLCSLGIVTYSNIGINNRLCAPNKLFEYAQAGLPMVLSSQETLQYFNTRYLVGEIIQDGFTPEEIGKIMARIIQYPHQYYAGLQSLIAEYSCASENKKLNNAICAAMIRMGQ